MPQRGLYFDNERLYFYAKEYDLLDDDEYVCMVDNKGSLQHE